MMPKPKYHERGHYLFGEVAYDRTHAGRGIRLVHHGRFRPSLTLPRAAGYWIFLLVLGFAVTALALESTVVEDEQLSWVVPGLSSTYPSTEVIVPYGHRK